MRKAMILILMAFILLITGATIISADDESLCDTEWYCPDDEDPYREDWNWSCGWYYGQYYAGNISEDEIPEWCEPPPPIEEELEGPAAGCYAFNIIIRQPTAIRDLGNGVYYTGVPNVENNLFWAWLGEGCTWDPVFEGILVVAEDQNSAEDICGEFFDVFTVSDASDMFDGLGPNAFLCSATPPIIFLAEAS